MDKILENAKEVVGTVWKGGGECNIWVTHNSYKGLV